MSSHPNNEITNEKLVVYQIIFAMIVKGVLIISSLVAFFIILAYLIKLEGDTTKMMILGSFELLLAGSTFIVFKHYFPIQR